MMMRRRTFVAMAAAAGTALVAPARGFAQAEATTATSMTETTPQTGYAPVNGLEMYYEIHGSGEPLVLLHSAFYTIELWGPILAIPGREPPGHRRRVPGPWAHRRHRPPLQLRADWPTTSRR